MGSPNSVSDTMAWFYVGQHETRRSIAISDQVIHQAQSCGYDMITSPVTTSAFHSSVLTMLSSTLSHLDNGDGSNIPLPLVSPLKPADTFLRPSDTMAQLLPVTSSWIDLASPDPLIAHLSRQVFNQEIAYAAFCGAVNIIVPGPKLHHGPMLSQGVAQYSRAILEALSLGSCASILIQMPIMDDPELESNDPMGHLASFARGEYKSGSQKRQGMVDMFGTWDAWNIVRSTCKYNSRLSVALSLPRLLPPISVQSRWYSEPVRLLVLPGTTFVTNARGSWVLPKAHQTLIMRLMRLRNPPWILLSDVGSIPGLDDPNTLVSVSNGFLSPGEYADASTDPSPTPAEAARMQQARSEGKGKDTTPHLSYIRHLQRHQPTKSTIERFGAGYQDFLQSPLQPLTDNLESITYEVFEKDPIKYAWYEQAIAQALRNWRAQGKPTSSPNGVVVAVVGAGRGPLVTRAIKASQAAGVPIDAWAVEKNPNAYVVLQNHNDEDWNGCVTVVKSDMRAWKGPVLSDGTLTHVDILVSELLGSFGDNELSPECLDGVQHVLNPTNGISIPASYTAHLTPVASPKLYADIGSRFSVDPNCFETPFVVFLHQIDYLSTMLKDETTKEFSGNGIKHHASKHDFSPEQPDVQTAWAFSHPAPASILEQADVRRSGSIAGGGGGATGGGGSNEHNARFARLTFRCRNRGSCHGLGGYFETVLYDGGGNQGKVELSTNPINMGGKSKDMISWFPIFFPLKTPLYVPDNSELEVSMWRQTDDRKVWYEWMVEAFVAISGNRVRLGASELHSSKKNGCLM